MRSKDVEDKGKENEQKAREEERAKTNQKEQQIQALKQQMNNEDKKVGESLVASITNLEGNLFHIDPLLFTKCNFYIRNQTIGPNNQMNLKIDLNVQVDKNLLDFLVKVKIFEMNRLAITNIPAGQENLKKLLSNNLVNKMNQFVLDAQSVIAINEYLDGIISYIGKFDS
jgi:hypothetical protein